MRKDVGRPVSRAKDKGTAVETAVVDYLRTHGHPHAERRTLGGANDRGDIAGIPRTVIEVKAVAATSYGAWLAEAERERINAAEEYGVVIHKPRGLGAQRVGDWHVVMTLETYTRLMEEVD
jgi:hypothetical protein